MKQILFNLLDNAVKFTPQGGAVSVAARPADSGWLELKVSDSGVGMDSALVTAVQEPFNLLEGEDHLVRASDSAAGGHTSPRLNLPLAKLLAQAHGGSLEIESSPGIGTTVTVRLPTAPGPADDARGSPLHALPPANPDTGSSRRGFSGVGGLGPAYGD